MSYEEEDTCHMWRLDIEAGAATPPPGLQTSISVKRDLVLVSKET